MTDFLPERWNPATRKTYAFQRAELVRRHRGHASRFGEFGAGGDVVVQAATAPTPAKPVLPLHTVASIGVDAPLTSAPGGLQSSRFPPSI